MGAMLHKNRLAPSSLAFLGTLRDKVGQGNSVFSADGALDGSFRVTVQAGSGARTVTRLELRRASGGVWDTDPATANWALGAGASLDESSTIATWLHAAGYRTARSVPPRRA